jgi:hypothetical protein
MRIEINDRLRNRKLEFFTDVDIHMKYDSLGSTFQFRYKFDPANSEQKEFSCVAHYHIAKIIDGKDLLMTGYVTSQEFEDGPEENLVRIGGYSRPGVLQDCNIPTGEPTSWLDASKHGYAKEVLNKSWPQSLQYVNMSLAEITQRMCNPFNIGVVVDASVATEANQAYETVEAKDKQSIKNFICQLASQKNIIVTDDVNGNVKLTRPRITTPVFHFEGKELPCTKMNMKFNGPGMHSHIKVFQQADAFDGETPMSEAITENPYVFTVFRPKVVMQDAGNANDSGSAGKNTLSDELRNIPLTLELSSWRLKGQIVKPGMIISVTNPKVYLYKKSNWFVEEVHLKGNASSQTATLKCVIPEIYTGETPSYLFKGINLHA